jgi:hypothetical protein
MMVALPNGSDGHHGFLSGLANSLGVDATQLYDFIQQNGQPEQHHKPGDATHLGLPSIFPTNESHPSAENYGMGCLNMHGRALKHFNDDPKTMSSSSDFAYLHPHPHSVGGFDFSANLNLGSQDLNLSLPNQGEHTTALLNEGYQSLGLVSNPQISLTPVSHPVTSHPATVAYHPALAPSPVESHPGLHHPIGAQVMHCSGGALDSDSRNYTYVDRSHGNYVYTNAGSSSIGYAEGNKLYGYNAYGSNHYEGCLGSDLRVYNSSDKCIGYVTPSGCGYLPNGTLYVQASTPLNAAFTIIHNMTSH